MGSTFVLVAMAVAALAVGLAVGVAWGRILERKVLLRVRASAGAQRPRPAGLPASAPASVPASVPVPPDAAAGSPREAAHGDDARAAPTDGPRVAAPAVLRLAANGEIELPAVVGRYKLESVLGRGAMGCVYRGLDAKVGRDIALKTLLPQAEALAAARLREDLAQGFAIINALVLAKVMLLRREAKSKRRF